MSDLALLDVLSRSIGYLMCQCCVTCTCAQNPCRQLSEEGDAFLGRRERAAYGLKEVLQLRPRELLPYLVPKLITRPITAPHARALAAVAQVRVKTMFFSVCYSTFVIRVAVHYSDTFPNVNVVPQGLMCACILSGAD